MSAPFPRWLWPVAGAAVILTAQAQPPARDGAPRPDPLDPQAAVPALRHESALAGYRRLSQDEPINWREANDTVRSVGGWRAYAREASAPPPAAAASAASAVKP